MTPNDALRNSGRGESVPRVDLGVADIVTSRIGLGCAGWPESAGVDRVAEVLRTAFDVGIRYIDCAAKYNTEKQIGEALDVVGRPADLTYATKAGVYWDSELQESYVSYSVDALLRSVDRSLKSLKVDRLDIIHLHDVAAINIPVAFSEDGPLGALVELRRQGICRAVGVASFDNETLLRAIEIKEFDVIQEFHGNTLLNRNAHDEIFPRAQERGVPVLDAAPYAGYILATANRPGATYNYRPLTPKVVAAVERLAEACRRKSVSLSDAAIAFALRHPAVKVVSVGSGNPSHIRAWARAANLDLSDADFAELLEAVGPSVSSSPRRRRELRHEV